MSELAGLFDLETLKTRLYSAVLSDVLDQLGSPNQALKPFMRPLDEASILCAGLVDNRLIC